MVGEAVEKGDGEPGRLFGWIFAKTGTISGFERRLIAYNTNKLRIFIGWP